MTGERRARTVPINNYQLTISARARNIAANNISREPDAAVFRNAVRYI